MSASSEYAATHAAKFGRLNAQTQQNAAGQIEENGGWAAKDNNGNQYLQIKFSEVLQISGVITQGASDADQWVTKYKLEYSSDGSTWTYYPDVRKNDSFADEESNIYQKNLWITEVVITYHLYIISIYQPANRW